jgi:acyl carrier protein
MLSVEEEFDLKVPDREMTPANFRTIARIVKLVRELSLRPVTQQSA